MSQKARGERPQLRLTLPPRPVEEVAPAGPDEAPFFRPKNRLKVKRARRGLLTRGTLALQLGAAGLLLLAGLWLGYSRVMASERLRVARVDVRGQRFLSEGEVRELLGPAVGENILTLDLAELKRRLRASPWVADATVVRTLPDTLSVAIVERVPLALAEADRLYLMDGDGTLIDVYGPRTAVFDMPIVRGLAGVDGEARRDRAGRAGALLADLGELGAEVSEVQVESSGDLRVVLRGAGEILKVGAPPYRKKFTTFLGLRRELAERCPSAEYFDLRFRDRIYAKEPPPPSPSPIATANPIQQNPNPARAAETAAPDQREQPR
ncbi:MAG: cell division protein FtsQ/DivIB [Vicinamibacteria bacterium]